MAARRVEVGPLADGDVAAAGAAIARAFQDEPMLVHVLPDPAERAQRAPVFFAQGLAFARLVGAAYAPVAGPTGAVFGWPLPLKEVPPERLAAAGVEPLPTVLGEEAAARFAALEAHIEAAQAHLVPPPCWYLAAIGVDPAHQGRGIGGALARAFLADAAAAGLPVCLWTDRAANLPFYRGLGMALVGEGVAPGSGLRYWIFRRDPV
jgi:GNAT superfamily N-acetyltransferase